MGELADALVKYGTRKRPAIDRRRLSGFAETADAGNVRAAIAIRELVKAGEITVDRNYVGGIACVRAGAAPAHDERPRLRRRG